MSNRLLIMCLMMLIILPAAAKDLGTKGHTHRIIEQPFIQMIKERLAKVDIQKENQKMKQIAKDRVENPAPVEGIVPATEYREFFWDPSFTLEEDAVLPCGKVLYYAGITVNPLEAMDFDRRLFFIDAREERQVKWLKGQLAKPASEQTPIIEDRIILIGGSVFELKKQQDLTEVYFDQSGELTTKFGIKASPAIVEQEGKQLKIREVIVSE